MRQMMMPDATGGGNKIEMDDNVVQRVEGIDELISEDRSFEKRQYEWTTLPEIKKSLKGKVIMLEEEKGLEDARNEREDLVLWTDGLRKEDEWTGCAVVWEEDQGWGKRRIHLCRQKEAYDAEMNAMSEAVKIAEEISKSQEVMRVMIFTDTQATLK
jgi:hypothetical protein